MLALGFLCCLTVFAIRLALISAKSSRLAERLLVIAVVIPSAAVLIPTLLGMAGVFHRWTLLGSGAALALASLARPRAWLALRQWYAEAVHSRVWRGGATLWICALAAVLWTAWTILMARLPSFGWDDYSYHGTWMIHVYQSGHLGPFPVADS